MKDWRISDDNGVVILAAFLIKMCEFSCMHIDLNNCFLILVIILGGPIPMSYSLQIHYPHLKTYFLFKQGKMPE